MDPLPGHLFVEFSKDGADGSSTKEKADGTFPENAAMRFILLCVFLSHGQVVRLFILSAGLDVGRKKGHDSSRIYLTRVEPPASSKLTVGDRLIALNGKSVESFNGDLNAIRQEFKSNNVVQLVVDPTMLK